MPASVREQLADVLGLARVDVDPGRVVERLAPGEVAVTDVCDLDRGTAQALLRRSPAAVVSSGPLLSGRRAAPGAALLLDSGVLVVADAGSSVLTLTDGQRVRVSGGRVIAVGDRHRRDAGVAAPPGSPPRWRSGSHRRRDLAAAVEVGQGQVMTPAALAARWPIAQGGALAVLHATAAAAAERWTAAGELAEPSAVAARATPARTHAPVSGAVATSAGWRTPPPPRLAALRRGRPPLVVVVVADAASVTGPWRRLGARHRGALRGVPRRGRVVVATPAAAAAARRCSDGLPLVVIGSAAGLSAVPAAALQGVADVVQTVPAQRDDAPGAERGSGREPRSSVVQWACAAGGVGAALLLAAALDPAAVIVLGADGLAGAVEEASGAPSRPGPAACASADVADLLLARAHVSARLIGADAWLALRRGLPGVRAWGTVASALAALVALGTSLAVTAAPSAPWAQWLSHHHLLGPLAGLAAGR